ncbi:MAG: DUF5671 domain-containing protein [Candidatus Zambryskibacteria bacterium]|nr:DUF5671 domain-containing protein [Candidatus Zambryskibacteria bacterium]
MEPTTQSHSHAKNVFLNLASMVTLYSAAAALLNLLFTVINKAFPQVTQYYSYYNNTSSISFPVATLIIVFPLYVLFMWLIERDLAGSQAARASGIRKWLIYITLFISGGLVVGDLVAVVYYFIDGQELTAGFLLKVLSILVVAGGVFGYYITDIRNKLSSSARKISIIVASVCIVAAIVAGFMVLGSPRVQRLVKYDQTKISDLQNIASQVRYFYDTNKVLPQTLTEIAQGNTYGGGTYTDVQTSKPYVYKIINATTFEVCAVFNKDFKYNSGITSANEPVTKSDEQGVVEVWGAYKAGESCFRHIVGPSTVPFGAPVKI